MKRSTSKAIVAAAWMIFACGAFLYRSQIVDGQTLTADGPAILPDTALIEKFDREVHARFLTMPFFGISRMAPTTPQPLRSNHVGSFMPSNPAEAEIVKSFTDGGWDVGLYLYGRRAEPKLEKGKPKEEFDIRYRVNQPVKVTLSLKDGELPEAKGIIDEVKTAFLTFQNETADAPTNIEFVKGDWSYIARPVRAMNESCIKCHNDYVILDKLPNGQFKMRKRQVGDVNGVLLYAFRRRK